MKKKATIRYMAFPLENELTNKIDEAIAGIRNGSPKAQAVLLAEIGVGLSDAALGHYLERSLDLMKLNFLLRKIAMVAVHATKKAMNPVIRKICRKLDDDQLRAAADILEDLQIEQEVV